jgi:hypothetical protein
MAQQGIVYGKVATVCGPKKPGTAVMEDGKTATFTSRQIHAAHAHYRRASKDLHIRFEPRRSRLTLAENDEICCRLKADNPTRVAIIAPVPQRAKRLKANKPLAKKAAGSPPRTGKPHRYFMAVRRAG